jgi:hypothetical protein
MQEGNKLTRALASGFILAGGAAICAWIWPEDGSVVVSGVAILTFAVSVLVVASVWKK